MEPFIPIFLIVFGISFVIMYILLFFKIYETDEAKEDKWSWSMMVLFLFQTAWLIAGQYTSHMHR